MDKLSDVFKDKLVEYEFRSPMLDEAGEILPPYQKQIDELRANTRRMRNLDLQAEHLYARLRRIQKNYCDDMQVIDAFTPKRVDSPWKSATEFTRNKYVWWDVRSAYLAVAVPHMLEVVIRKEGHEKDIKVLDQICKRIESLDVAASKLNDRNDTIKKELTDVVGVWDVIRNDPNID